MGSIKNQQSFRGDLELLRGLAVILVVIFHLKLNIFKSGFIGVDIFFVISGFLMAAAFNDPESNILEFYERRARRVLPTAFVIFFVFFIVSPFLFLPFETQKVSESFLSMLLLSPNIGFWLENGYFDEFTFRPMLHYWSLGVEFQYYLVFPLLVYFFQARKGWYLVLLIISFLISILLTNFSVKTAFFLLPFRLWEFLVGYFAFQVCSGDKLNFLGSKYNSSISLAALLGLVASALYDIPQESFPGFYALFPTVLSFIFIAFGLPNSEKLLFGVGYVLRYLGKISYSIYLIHYPVIFLFIYSPFSAWKTIGIADAFVIIFITFSLSVLSYNYLETPFRNRKSIPSPLLLRMGALFFLLSFGLIYAYGKLSYFSSSYSLQERKIFFAVNDQEGWFCSYLEKIKSYNAKSCRLNNLISDRNFLLVGDSHMDAIKHLFVNKAAVVGAGVRMVRDSCILGKGGCTANLILSETQINKTTDIVLLGYKPTRFNFEQLSSLVSLAGEKGVRLHFIMPIPTYSKSVPQFLFESLSGRSELNKYIYSREVYYSRIPSEYLAFMKDNEARKNVYFYDPSKYLCDEMCKIQDDVGILYHDSHHLSLTGSRKLIPLVDEIFAMKVP